MDRTLAAFDPGRFEALANEAGLDLGGKVHFFETTGSTNDEALAAARSGAAGGSVFVADAQCRGRGRRGRQWTAQPRSALLVSVLLRPQRPRAGAAPWLTLATGLGLRACLQRHIDKPIGLKWPNDLLVGERKIAGILCEATLVGTELRTCVVGVGINVWAAPQGESLRRPATSLAAEGARAVSREALLVDVVRAIDARAEALTRSVALNRAAYAEEFAAHDVLFGKAVTAEGNPPVVGIAQGIDAECNLRVVTAEGVRFVRSGDIDPVASSPFAS